MRIDVSPNPSLIHESVQIQVVGLQPQQIVTVRTSRMTHVPDQTLRLGSHATFLADDNGQINVGTESPLSGNYEGIDPMGLFWSLEVEDIKSEDNSRVVGHVLQPQIMTLSVESSDGVLLGSVDVTRSWLADDVVRIPVRERGLVATFFASQDSSPRPTVIFVSGSEGGMNEFFASLFASNGFTTLALAYFGIEHLPKRASEIPLEYVETAVEWLKGRAEVAPGWLGIHGTSKGAELALWAGALFPDVKAVVSLNGGALSFAGIVPWSDSPTLPPAWTYQGKPLPYASPDNPISIARECLRMRNTGEGNPLGLWYRTLASDPEVVSHATIPVERIQGPVLFVTGEDDGDVPYFAQLGVKRLTNNHHPYPYAHLNYPGGTHALGIPNVRVTMPGKSAQAVNAASADAWKQTVDFFRISFYGSGGGK